jgi:hypothetical protein
VSAGNLQENLPLTIEQMRGYAFLLVDYVRE